MTTKLLVGDVIYESATMGEPSGNGPTLSSTQFLGSRFSVSEPVVVTAIGGHIKGTDLFGAIISLSGPSAVPQGIPASEEFPLGSPEIVFANEEIIAFTTFAPDGVFIGSDFRVPLSVTLPPGDYLLVFGSGLFGATGQGAMPKNNTDLLGASQTFWFSGHAIFGIGIRGWLSNVSVANTRFVDEGVGLEQALGDLLDFTDSLDPADFSKKNAQKTLGNKINAILNSLALNDVVSICEAIDKLANDLLPKTDGLSPPPDWVTEPTAREELADRINAILDALQDEADAQGGCL